MGYIWGEMKGRSLSLALTLGCGNLLLNLKEDMGAAPHAFQVVITTLLFLEEMDDRIAVIHQHPTAFGCPLNRGRQLIIGFLDLFAHIIG